MRRLIHVAVLTLTLLGAFATPLFADGTEPIPTLPPTKALSW
jgi:hypothetical protein